MKTVADNKRKNKMLAAILACVFTLLLIAVPFLTVFITGIALPAQYSETYYSELAEMYSRLKNTKGKKIVVIGNSSVAFGVDSALAEELLADAGLDYTVCNLGLYGSLGTVMMLEIADNYIEEGDIVIFTPEVSEQSLSMYFSASEAWLAVDSDHSMFSEFSSEYKGSLAGNFFGYTADKLSLYRSGTPAQASGIYAKSSFDSHCDLKNYDRPYNMLEDEVDANNPISLDTTLFAEDFIEYVNEFYAEIKDRGAEMYYSFAPMNEEAVSGDTSAFYDFVCDRFDFTVMSDIEDYIMDKEWFYDSNYHLNSSGMTVRTVNLVNDIKNQLGNNTKTDIVLPDKPVKPDFSIEGEGDNSYAQYFTYELDGSYYTITGLTEEGRQLKEIVVPYQVNGVYVKSFTADVFAGNTDIQSVTVQSNISSVADGSFNGCTSLKKIIFTHGQPSDISVGYGLLDGTSAVIYVPQESVSAFKNNYFWGHYADKIYGC